MKKRIISSAIVVLVLVSIISATFKLVDAADSRVDYDTVYSVDDVNLRPVPWEPEFMNYDAPAVEFVEEESSIGVSNSVTYRSSVDGNIDATLDDSGDVIKGNATYDLADGPDYHLVNGDGTLAIPKGTAATNYVGKTIIPLGVNDDITNDNDPDVASKKVVVIYPEALIVAGKKYDVKATYSNFFDLVEHDRRFQTLQLNNYLFEGFWFFDVQSVDISYELLNDSGEEIDASELGKIELYMGSLNGYPGSGEYMSPLQGVKSVSYVDYVERETSVTYEANGEVVNGIYDIGKENPVTGNSESNAVNYVLDSSPKVTIGTTSAAQAMWAVPILRASSDQETLITKEITSESGSKPGVLEAGETIEYKVTVDNDTSFNAVNVAVRDNLLENTPDYLTYNNDVAIQDATATGDITKGTYTIDVINPKSSITITYSMTVGDDISGVSEVQNLVTDTGDDPNLCTSPDNIDCATVILPVVDTVISKSIIDESIAVDNVVTQGEDITYQISVSNDTEYEVKNVTVRDSLLESLPEGATLVSEVTSTLPATGSLTDSTYTISSIPAQTTVNITYTINYAKIDKDLPVVVNIATDNGEMYGPDDELPEGDAAKVEIPTAYTNIEKQISSESGSSANNIEQDEILTYTITIKNPTNYDAVNVPLRDSLFEDLPAYLTYNYDFVLTGATGSGDLVGGTYIIDSVPANGEVTATYSMTVNTLENVSNVINIATDDGKMYGPGDELPEGDAAKTVITNSSTTISKAIIDESIEKDGAIESNESITYQITVTNDSEFVANDIPVRDSMLENLPSYASYDGTVTSNVEFSGSFTDSNLKITALNPGEVATLTYVVAFATLDADNGNITNFVSDNGVDPLDLDADQLDYDNVSAKVVEDEPKGAISSTGVSYIISAIIILMLIIFSIIIIKRRTVSQ